MTTLRPRFNPCVAKLDPPPVPLVHGWASAYDGRLGPLIDLSQAVPGYPPHPTLLKRLGETAATVQAAGYGAIEGDDDLRDALAKHAEQVYQAPVDANSVHITSGCNQAFMVSVMAIAAAGDRVLLTSPSYFNHDAALAILGVQTGRVACAPDRDFLPDCAAIDAAIDARTKALALVTPNNPTGAIYPPELIEEIFHLCQRRGIWLIIDETYRDFVPPDSDPPHRLFDNPAWRDGFIQLYSFSKSYCIPGHRLGAITAGPVTVAQIAKVMDNLQICAPRAAQIAVAPALAKLTEWRRANTQEIAKRAGIFSTELAELNGWDLVSIGAYFAYVKHPFANDTSVTVAERLAKSCGVLTIPGAFFGEGQERFLRFAFANCSQDKISRIAERIVALPSDILS